MESKTISVNGTGSVAAAPDVASINIGAASHGHTDGEALVSNSSVVTAILGCLNAAGIDARDVQAANVSLNPVWSSGRQADSPPQITGYGASNDHRARNLSD